MAIVDMRKMHLLGLKKEQDKILSRLQEIGAVEIIDIAGLEEDESKVQESTFHQKMIKELSLLDSKISKLMFGIEFLEPFVKKEINPIIYGKPKVSKKDLDMLLSREEHILSILDTISELDQQLSQLKGEESKIKNRIEQLIPWKDMDIPLQQLGPTEKSVFMPVIISKKGFDDFKIKLEENQLLAVLETVGEDQDDYYCLLIFYKDQMKQIEDISKDFSISVQEFAGLKGTPKQIIEEDNRRISQIEEERQAIRQKAQTFSEQRFNFQILYDYWSLEKDKKSCALKMNTTEKTFLLSAWVPEPDVQKVEQKMLEVTESIYIEFNLPEEDDEVPVVVSNPKLVQPFELITELYSLPDPKGIDPNIFMAPFYFVFFGMMLSDAGYGILISIVAAIALRKFKFAGMGKKLVQLMCICGISTVAWGAIFGGWFGDILGLKPLWINPLDDPMSVLILSFVFGVIQLYFGIMLKAYMNIRDGHVADAVMDQGLWLVFLSGLLMLAFPQTQSIAKYLSIIGAIGLILTQGRAQKNIINKLLSGILSLYDITGYLSDLLSYSRLLALGLATGVIATVINTMVKLLGVNVIGWIFAIIIFIGGHIFNLAVSGLGAYVHSSRLQYIEFFGKFYESGGRPFSPMEIRTRYVDIKD